jgi:phytoene dehydrogenase-like protein
VSARYDVIVIGAGHNGLTAAAYLARAGLSVLVLERRSVAGGCTTTEEFHPGFRADLYADRVGPLDRRVVRDLGLDRRGLEFVRPDPARVVVGGGRALPLYRTPERAARALQSLAPRDAARWPAFCRRLADAVALLDDLRRREPPALPEPSAGDLLALARSALRARLRGRSRFAEVLRLLPMPVADLLDEWFEDPLLKGGLAACAVSGLMQGPYGAGTVFGWLQQLAPGMHPGGEVVLVRGGVGRLALALAQAAREAGAEIRLGAAVEEVVPEDRGGFRVVLAGGQEVAARTVVSTLDPQRTLLQLVGAARLDPAVSRHAAHLRLRGVVAKVHLALAEVPRFVGAGEETGLRGAVTVAPSVEYVERAYDDAKYGRVSRHPVLEAVIPTLADPGLAPPGRHVMSVTVQYVPYRLDGEVWDADRRDALGEAVVQRLAEHAPGLPQAVIARQVLVAPDFEAQLGLTQGDIYQGQPALDQSWFMRPLPGWARYRLPVAGLYLGGAGAHPGGGVTAGPGYGVARAVLADLRRR